MQHSLACFAIARCRAHLAVSQSCVRLYHGSREGTLDKEWRAQGVETSTSWCSAATSSDPQESIRRATTILCVKRGTTTVMIGDGQVSMGSTVLKPNARKVRRIGADGSVVAGIAGATADAMTLLDRLEQKLEAHPNQLKRACVEMAKSWRTDKYLRPLEATMIVADSSLALEITGVGDVLEPFDGVVGIGSGSGFAIAAARALIDQPNMTALEIAKKAMNIASDMCVYTNKNFVIEIIESSSDSPAASPSQTPSNQID